MLPVSNYSEADTIKIGLNSNGSLIYIMHLDEDDYHTGVMKLSQLFINNDTSVEDVVPQIIYHLWRSVGEKKLAKKVKAQFNQVIKDKNFDYQESLYIAIILGNAISIAFSTQCVEDTQNTDSPVGLKVEVQTDGNGDRTCTVSSKANVETCLDELSKQFSNKEVDYFIIIPQIIYHLWNAIEQKTLAQEIKVEYNQVKDSNYNKFESLYVASVLLNALMEAVILKPMEDDNNSTDEVNKA